MIEKATGTPRNRNARQRRRQKMARVSTYLNFPRTTEEAFSFYKTVFGTEFSAPIARFRDIPAQPGQPPLPEADRYSMRWMFNCASKA